MNALNLLAFDLGAGSGRAVLGRFDGSRLTLQPVHQFASGPVAEGGRLYTDAKRLLNEVKRGLARAGSLCAGRLDALGIDTWGVDYGLIDPAGQLLDRPRHYRDPRTAGMFERAFAAMGREEIFRRTGIAFHPFNTLYQLLAERLGRPEVLERSEAMLMLPDLLAYFLTGEIAAEYTDATTTQLVGAHARTWSAEVIAAMGLPERIFPALQPPGTVRGLLRAGVAEATALAAMPVVAVASHDTASAVVAAGVEADAHAYLSSGTWSLLGVEVDRPVVTEAALRWNFTNEGGVEGRYRLLRNIAGLWIFEECRREWSGGAGGADGGYERLLAAARDSGPLVSLIDPDAPAFASPGDMPGKVRRFCAETHQPVPADRGAVLRCIFESLAMKYRWAVDRLEEIIGRRIETLHVVGGGNRNALLNEFTAAALDRPVVCGPTEATAVGNLMMQAAALGEVEGLDEIRRVVRRSFPQVLYKPQAPARWAEAYQRFLRVVV